MKLPSINYLYQKAKISAIRFPISLISSLIGVILGIYLIENEKTITNIFPYLNVILTAALGIPLLFCIEVFAKKFNFGSTKRIIVNTSGIAVLFLLFLTLPDSEITANTSMPYIRYTIYNIAMHLLVSFIPFIKTNTTNGFWQYNRVLFIRFVTSAIYSGFLYVGIALALVSLNLLFEVKIHDKLYAELFIFIGGFFNTWFFIAGMPDNFDDLEDNKTYPFGLKVFTQYILFPLLALYLVILYGYGIKIVSIWDWPKGVVSYLIVCVAVLGIFNLLLMFPYGNLEGNRWVKITSRAYYILLIPLIIMLFIAISMRLNDYGITINRYIIYVLGVWLSLVSLYFVIGKTNIKFIPTSLCMVILLTSFGPWSMFSVSENSQVTRLKNLLEKNKLLENNKIVNEQIIKIDSNYYNMSFVPQNQLLLNDSLKNEIKSILDYLDDHHGFNKVKGWYSQDFDNQINNYNANKERWSRINEAEIYMRALGLDYTYYYSDSDYMSYSTNNYDAVIDVKGYDYETKVNFYLDNRNKSIKKFNLDSNEYELKHLQKNNGVLELYKNNQIHSSIDLNPLKDNLIRTYGKNQQYNLQQKELMLQDSTTNLNYKLMLENIAFNTENDSIKLSSFNGVIFFTIKDMK
ncbi:MAG: DUF4153 domain-containing protein [Flavobacteriales bacterium]